MITSNDPTTTLTADDPSEQNSQSVESPTTDSPSAGPGPKEKPRRPRKPETPPKEKPSKRGSDEPGPRSEREGWLYFQNLKQYIEKRAGQFLKAEDGSLQLVAEGRRIALDDNPQNFGMVDLMLTACKVTLLTPGARAGIQRLQNHANKKASKMSFRHFSAVSADGDAIYIPIKSGQLLRITSAKIDEVPNGNNVDSLWLEHPYEEPLSYRSSDAKTGLAHFERLIVNSQSCKHPEMKWLVAMQEGLFPFIRDAILSRFITLHIGASQQGKTTGAQRFTLLHGLGEVKGEYSPAALANEGDIGLIVVDNKEQANFGQQLIDYFLFLSTGAEYGRSSPTGKNRTSRGRGRPVGVITTIEGVLKRELQLRTVRVDYEVSGEMLDRGGIESEIRRRRHEIGSALVSVLQQYLRVRKKELTTPNPIPNFKENFQAIADLLRAFGLCRGEPAERAEGIISGWASSINGQEVEESELEHPILQLLKDSFSTSGEISSERVKYKDRQGILYITTCGALLNHLRPLSRETALPRTPVALGRRLRTESFRSFDVLDEDSAPELISLKRTGKMRKIGFFVADERDDKTGNDRVS